MPNREQEVLVAPRRLLNIQAASFVPWMHIEPELDELEGAVKWYPRSEAERSTTWVQLIAAALIRDKQGRYCILRRKRDTSNGLQGRLTLVVGGHVDRSSGLGGVRELLVATLRKELYEEIGLSYKGSPQPIGLFADLASVESSRHMAFVYEVVTDKQVKSNAPEEFATKSKFSGQFLPPDELAAIHSKFDPWSTLILEDYICTDHAPRRGWQRKFPINPDPVVTTTSLPTS